MSSKVGIQHQENVNLAEELADEGGPDSLDITENTLLSAGETVLLQAVRSDVKNT